MTDDLVTLLRYGWNAPASERFFDDLCSEAADEIESLRAALRRVSHAPHGKAYSATGHEEAVLIARAALSGEKPND
jgi:uncharacterized protein YerC